MRKVWAAGGVIGAGALALCCAELVGLDHDYGTSTAPDDSGLRAFEDAMSAACADKGWPTPPSPTDDGGNDQLPFVLYLGQFRVDPNDPNVPIGFNLDGTCTCPGPESCTLPDAMPESASPITCDIGPGGDAGAIDAIESKALFSVESLACHWNPQSAPPKSGGYLVRVYGYNGTPNDSRVIVELFISTGCVDDSGQSAIPNFDGNDRWQIWSETLDSDSGYASFTDLEAYVRDGVLVARPHDTEELTPAIWPYTQGACDAGFETNGNPLVVWLGGFVMSGRLVDRDDAGFTLAGGRIGGRIPTDGPKGLLAAAGGLGLCPGSPLGVAAAHFMCSFRDIASKEAADNTGAPCSALSYAAGFVGTPARIGPTLPLSLAPGCDAASDAYVCP